MLGIFWGKNEGLIYLVRARGGMIRRRGCDTENNLEGIGLVYLVIEIPCGIFQTYFVSKTLLLGKVWGGGGDKVTKKLVNSYQQVYFWGWGVGGAGNRVSKKLIKS